MDKPQVLMYSIGIEYPEINSNGIEYKNVYMCIIESLCYIAEIGTTL